MRRKRGRRAAVAVCVGIVAVGFLIPTLLTIAAAFMSRREVLESYGSVFAALGDGAAYLREKVSLRLFPRDVNFLQFFIVLFQRSDYLLKFWNAVLLVVPIVLGQLLVASMAAYSLARRRTGGRRLFLFCCLVLMLMPVQVTLVPQYMVARELALLGTMRAIIFPGIFAPFALYLLTSFMQRIPTAQLEAAQLDGAGEWRLFTRICLPQCRSMLYSIGILLFIDYWNMVEQPLVLLADPRQQPLSVSLSSVQANNAGMAFAAAVLYMIPPLLLFLHGERHLVAGITHAGVSMGIRAQHGVDGEVGRGHRWVTVAAAAFFGAVVLLTVFSEDISERVTPEAEADGLLYGLFEEAPEAVVVPTAAILEEDGDTYVLIVGENDPYIKKRYQALRVDIEILASDGEFAAVDGNLDLFNSVLVEWSSLPQDGQYVVLSDD